MNPDSLPLCEGMLKPGGLMLVNSSLVKTPPNRKDLKVAPVDAQGIAESIGSPKFANMVALGAMAKLTGALDLADIELILKKFFPPDKHRFIPQNVEAIQAGGNAAKIFT
jgi:2-oxoglutarate ferredoxin oxidoreductase subunit gamma